MVGKKTIAAGRDVYVFRAGKLMEMENKKCRELRECLLILMHKKKYLQSSGFEVITF